MRINLAPVHKLGPVFDPDARGVGRFVPRRAWWPLLPLLVLAAPAIAAVVTVDALGRKLAPRAAL